MNTTQKYKMGGQGKLTIFISIVPVSNHVFVSSCLLWRDIEGAGSAEDFVDLWNLLRQAERKKNASRVAPQIVHGRSMVNLASVAEQRDVRCRPNTKSSVSLPSLNKPPGGGHPWKIKKSGPSP